MSHGCPTYKTRQSTTCSNLLLSGVEEQGQQEDPAPQTYNLLSMSKSQNSSQFHSCHFKNIIKSLLQMILNHLMIALHAETTISVHLVTTISLEVR